MNTKCVLEKFVACLLLQAQKEYRASVANDLIQTNTYEPDLVLCNFWLFPKLKSTLKGKRFQTVNETQENTMGQLMVIGRTV